MDFSSRQLTHFLAVIETASLLKASARLNVTQPALSKSIKALEDRLGVALFERLPRGVRPTMHGIAFEAYARRIMVDAQRAVLEMKDISAGSSGRIVAGIGTPYLDFVKDILPGFIELYPDSQLEIVSGAAGHLGKLLADGKVDFVLAMYNGLQQEDHRQELLIDHWKADEFVGICPAGDSIENRLNKPENLAHYRWALPLIDRSALSVLHAAFLSDGVRFPRVSLTTDSVELLKYAVGRRSMLSLIPKVTADILSSREIGFFHITGLDFQRNIGIVRHKDFDFSPLHDGFLKLLRAQFSSLDQNSGQLL